MSLGISGSLPDLMIRMLVQSKPREIALLPALPEQFTAGSIDGIPCRGQVLVKSLGWKEKQIHVILNSKIEQTVTLKFPGEIAEVRKVAGKTKTSQSGRANQLRLTLLAEEDTNLNIELK